MKVTVYSKPNCQQCRATERWLQAKNVEYGYIDVTKEEIGMAAAEGTGIRAMPIVIADGHAPWGGFQPDRLMALIE